MTQAGSGHPKSSWFPSACQHTITVYKPTSNCSTAGLDCRPWFTTSGHCFPYPWLCLQLGELTLKSSQCSRRRSSCTPGHFHNEWQALWSLLQARKSSAYNCMCIKNNRIWSDMRLDAPPLVGKPEVEWRKISSFHLECWVEWLIPGCIFHEAVHMPLDHSGQRIALCGCCASFIPSTRLNPIKGIGICHIPYSIPVLRVSWGWCVVWLNATSS